MDEELLLLGLLSGSAMHGYQLNETIAHRLVLFSNLKPSTAYSTLDRLAKNGFVESTAERVGRRPERKVYSLTAAGRGRFLELLRLNLRSADQPSPSGAKGLLFLSALPPEEVSTLLAERREGARALLTSVRRVQEGHPAGSPAGLAASHASALLEAEVGWLDRMLGAGSPLRQSSADS